MSDGIFPDEATIYITTSDTDGSALASSNAVTAEVSNFSETGGEKDVEPIPVFGGGNIDKENPRGQIEVSFDVQLQYSPSQGDSTKWDAFKYGSGLTSATEGSNQVIGIEWNSGSDFYTRFYNNAKGVTWNPTSSADGNLTGTMTFKLSPTDASGTANLKVKDAAISTSTFNW